MKIAVTLIYVFLAGCSSAPIVVHEPVEVMVPIATPCQVTVPPRPDLPIAALPATASRPKWLEAALVERERLLGYVPVIEAALAGCMAK